MTHTTIPLTTKLMEQPLNQVVGDTENQCRKGTTNEEREKVFIYEEHELEFQFLI